MGLRQCCIAGTSDAFPEVVIQFKLPNLAYRELAKATNNFHPFKFLGRGRFAMAYHGVLRDGLEIAVQRFCEYEFEIFQQYVHRTVILSLLPHKNLVSVYGCASNRKEYLLVHEYIPNGTLAYHLHGEGAESIMLPWLTRLDIAIDTADALAYLHSNGIIHGNVTPHNILLDENLCAKVKGILLSWQLPTGVFGGVTHVITHKIRGKYSYMDPDYLENGRLSVKSDVYSFGVVLCQLLSSQPAMDWEINKPITTATSVIRKFRNHALDKPLDPNLGFESDPGIMQMITKVAELATQCLNNEEELRPSMKQVFEGLKSIRKGRRESSLINGEDLKQQNQGLEHDPESDNCIKPQFQIFSHNVLAQATNHFDSSSYLGKGGFGSVYYGNLPDGREVAIKRFHEKKDKTIEQFMKEVEILSRLRHQNLVSLYGCNSENSDALLLVYEYVSNGSLATNLDLHSGSQLPWITRLNIAIETACALAYLHHSGIIHRDVKSSNILLDENFSVKVADFGLARFLPLEASQGDPCFVTHVSTVPVGTPAYIDPEYYESNRVSDKSDVYSFGVVLFQLISSKPSSFTQGPQYFTLANFAMGKILNNALEELVDPSLGFGSDNRVMETITAVAESAFQCVQCPKELRPSMKQVLETLEGIKQGSWGFNQIT